MKGGRMPEKKKVNLSPKKPKERPLLIIPSWDMEKISANIKICVKYQEMVGICMACHSLYLVHEDYIKPESLYNFKCMGGYEQKAFLNAISYVNNVLPPVEPDDLFSAGIKDFTGGLCCLCYALNRNGDKIRQDQIDEGNSPCFGSRLDSCPYKGCSHYQTCIVKRSRFTTWHKRVLYLQNKGLYTYEIRDR